MPDKTHSNETVWTEVNIAPRGKSWLHGSLIDGVHGYKTKQAMENAERAAHTVAPQHPDDAAVDALAALMKAKLAKQREKGYGGWDDTECGQQHLSNLLRGHVDKGDPVDVANFCAFLSARGEGISPAVDALPAFPAMTEELASILGLMCFQCIRFAQALRAGGYSIKNRAEDEQAAVLHWMLGHYFRSGPDGWRAAASADMERLAAQRAAIASAKGK